MIMKFAVISFWSSAIKHNTFDCFHICTAQISGSLGTGWVLWFIIKPFGIQQKSNPAVNSRCTLTTFCLNFLWTFLKWLDELSQLWKRIWVLFFWLCCTPLEESRNSFSKSQYATADFVNSAFWLKYSKLMFPNHWQQIIQPIFNTEIACPAPLLYDQKASSIYPINSFPE